MRKLMTTTAVAALMLAATAARAAENVEVLHWWTSGGEAAAVAELAKAFDATGNKWVDGAIAGSGGTARPIMVSRITGGDPMGATQFNHGRQAEELVQAGLMRDLTDVATRENWKEIVKPSSLLDSCTIEGKIYCAPVNIHSWQWLWLSNAAFQKAGVPVPKNWDEFVAAAPALEKAGIVPLALGGQPWQERATFDAVLLHFGGKDMYMNFIGGNGAALVQTPEFKQVLADFKRLKGYVDEGSPNRSWNEATALVIENKAGFQIMGDWAKGEFKAAGDTAGKEYGCIVGFGDKPSYMIAGDVFIFPKSNESDTAAQTHLAKLMLSPKVQVDFNNLKGSIPVRAGVDGSNMDVCAQAGLAAVSDPSRQVPNPEMRLSPDAHGMVTDAISNFWNTDQSVDEAVAALQSALSM